MTGAKWHKRPHYYFWLVIAVALGAIGCSGTKRPQTTSTQPADAAVRDASVRQGHLVSTLVNSDSRDNEADVRTPLVEGGKHCDPGLLDDLPSIENSLVIGLDADMSSASAASGESIRRGVELAIENINEQGGVLGRPLELIVRDHRGNPDRGKHNIAEFARMRDLVAVVGGIHTPVALQELPIIHEKRIVYLGPWAAGTAIVDNEYQPNYVFRVSVRDEYAGGFLVSEALRHGHEKIGLLLERTGWGRSNEAAILAAMKEHGIAPEAVEWVNWGQADLSHQMAVLCGCDVILLVCNTLEGVQTVANLAKLSPDKRPAVISHWGITAGTFFEMTRPQIHELNFSFLQPFSFLSPGFPERVQPVVASYFQKYPDAERVEDIFSPVGTAHAYEIVMMLAAATEAAGQVDSEAIRESLENLRDYRGIIRDYEHPFPLGHHDALSAEDFFLAKYSQDGVIVPLDEGD